MKTFATHNDTLNWLLIVDNHGGFFDTHAAAENAYNMVSSIDESAFGAMQLVPPGYRPVTRLDGSDMTQCRASECRDIDIVDYMRKRGIRACRLPARRMEPASIRIQGYKEMADIFGEDWRKTAGLR